MPTTAPETPPGSDSAKKCIHVAVAVIIRAGRVLIARRLDHAHQGGLLEFPGGKVESGETVQQALVREIREETGLQVPLASLEPVIGIRHDYGDKQVFLDVWKTTEAQGNAEGREGQAVDWRAPSALKDDDFPAANRPIIRALNLPGRLAISGAITSRVAGGSRLKVALAKLDSPLLVLRAPELAVEEYRQLAAQALAVCAEAGIGVILHGQPGWLEEFPGAAGLHLPWREAERLSGRPVPANRWLGVSCHDSGQLRHAERLGADYATLGPVLPTPTHPEQSGLGWAQFEALVAGASIPVYGLGGMAPVHENLCRERGGQGIAGISYWW
ncbi:Nudix family hydrolase [Marinobacter halophilus]|uniref:8-oxo-dGTP diphosphatase n=2 Tax=Marinobacter halophilus TaxID=1323740 RepID=A0A2T1KAZ2_9GAMM|nr:Nudix family hydrolase [Marinobacter halophilus]PSF07306.1 Nudix family hydrolase [Marinobacter halophilus]